MNELQMKNNLTLDSREVAEMMNINHWEVLRKLEGHGKNKGIIQTLGDNNFVVTDYFIKSTYLTEQNKEMTCYLFTKMGCEFIANKFTGEKGILFTAKYVKRFNEMESYMPKLSKELQAIIMIDQKQQVIENRLESLENNMTIDFGQQLELSNIAKQKAISAMGGINTQAYCDSSVRGKVFSAVWKDFKDYFQVNSYRNTSRKEYEKARTYLNTWIPQGKLLREIEECNSQIDMC